MIAVLSGGRGVRMNLCVLSHDTGLYRKPPKRSMSRRVEFSSCRGSVLSPHSNHCRGRSVRIDRLSDLWGLFVITTMAVTIRPIFKTLTLRVFGASVLWNAGAVTICALENRRQEGWFDLEVFRYHMHSCS